MLLVQPNQSSFQSSSAMNSLTGHDNSLMMEVVTSDSLEDLKFLDFPMYDDNLDDTSLDEMFSPSSSSFDPSNSVLGSNPNTPATCSSYTPSSSPILMSNLTSTSGLMSSHDLPINGPCHTPVSDGGKVSPCSSNGLLPSFMDTYSPRYRPCTSTTPVTTSSCSTEGHFFKFDDSTGPTAQSSSSSSTSSSYSSHPHLVSHPPMMQECFPITDHIKEEPMSDPIRHDFLFMPPISIMNQPLNSHINNNRSIVSMVNSATSSTSSSASSSYQDSCQVSPPLTPVSPHQFTIESPLVHMRKPHLLKTSMERTSASSSPSTVQSDGSSMALLCAVCGDAAACQHYGVRTCEGCKGFFKRTVQKGAKYVCLGTKDCLIDKRRRNRCQFCRFQKCLSVGMVKEVVRTDELKGRRGRLPSKPKSPQQSPASPPVSTITALVRGHLDSMSDTLFSTQKDCLTSDLMQHFYQRFTLSKDLIRSFCDKIPNFMDLDPVDQEILFQSSLLEVFSLRCAYRNMNSDSDNLILDNGMILRKGQADLLLGSEWVASLHNLSRLMTTMDMDISGFVCLTALSVISERSNLQNGHKVDQIQCKILSSLRDHCTYNHEAQQKNQYFSRILSRLPELRNISVQGVIRIQHLNQVSPLPLSLNHLFQSPSSFLLLQL